MDTLRATRVLSRDRRGDSSPVIVETDRGARIFTKLRGAAQGTSSLVAEIIVARLAEALRIRVPRRYLVLIDAETPSDDRNDELADLLNASRGYNLGFEILEGARQPTAERLARIDAQTASTIVWLDGLVMNPDRTARNPNILMRKDEPWLIDHGAALGFQHNWASVTEDSPRRVTAWREPHVLQEQATEIAELDELLAETLDRETIRAAIEEVPDDFIRPLLASNATSREVSRRREAYLAFLWKRLKPPRPFVGPVVLNAKAQGRKDAM